MINWKIDISDLINILLFIVAGVFGYYLLDKYQREDSRFAVIETLANNVKSISPGLDIHYVNQMAKDGSSLEMQIYIKNVSTHDVWIGTPNISYSHNGKNSATINNESAIGFNSMLAPSVDLCLSFNLPRPEESNNTISLEFQAETVAAYSKTILLAVAELSDTDLKKEIEESISASIKKKYSYGQYIFKFGTNDIWSDFCLSPR